MFILKIKQKVEFHFTFLYILCKFEQNLLEEVDKDVNGTYKTDYKIEHSAYLASR
jgi:hypothetical protein